MQLVRARCNAVVRRCSYPCNAKSVQYRLAMVIKYLPYECGRDFPPIGKQKTCCRTNVYADECCARVVMHTARSYAASNGNPNRASHTNDSASRSSRVCPTRVCGTMRTIPFFITKMYLGIFHAIRSIKRFCAPDTNSSISLFKLIPFKLYVLI